MGIRQVEKLYKKIVSTSRSARVPGINVEVREEIFRKIMDDLERLMHKLERCEPESPHYQEIDLEIRSLLLKEVQVIIDDYMLSKRSGTLVRWKKMYGTIDHYIADFYRFRDPADFQATARVRNRYGFCQDDNAD